MGESSRFAATTGPLAWFAGGSPMAAPVTARVGNAWLVESKAVATVLRKDNDLVRHWMDDGEALGNIRPVLVALQARFPDRKKLRA